MERPEKKLIFVKVMGQDSEIDEVKSAPINENKILSESEREFYYLCYSGGKLRIKHQ